MKANKKKTAKKSRTVSPKKPKAARKKKVPTAVVETSSFATFLDNHMMAGITWAKLEKLAVAEADRRHITSQRTVGALKAHARSRGYQDRWTVTMDDNEVKMNMRQKKGGKS